MGGVLEARAGWCNREALGRDVAFNSGMALSAARIALPDVYSVMNDLAFRGGEAFHCVSRRAD